MIGPDDAVSDDIYGRMQPESIAPEIAAFVDRMITAVKNPDDADGWPALIVPAIVTGLAVALARKVIL